MRKLLAKIGVVDKTSFWKLVRELVSFGAVGATNICLQYGVYHLFLTMRVHYAICNIFAFIATVLNSYVWYTLFVFKPKNESGEMVTESMNVKFESGKRFGRMIITNIGYLILSSVLIIFFVQVADVPEEVAPLLGIGILIPYSFLVTKFWVYKK